MKLARLLLVIATLTIPLMFLPESVRFAIFVLGMATVFTGLFVTALPNDRK